MNILQKKINWTRQYCPLGQWHDTLLQYVYMIHFFLEIRNTNHGVIDVAIDFELFYLYLIYILFGLQYSVIISDIVMLIKATATGVQPTHLYFKVYVVIE